MESRVERGQRQLLITRPRAGISCLKSNSNSPSPSYPHQHISDGDGKGMGISLNYSAQNDMPEEKPTGWSGSLRDKQT